MVDVVKGMNGFLLHAKQVVWDTSVVCTQARPTVFKSLGGWTKVFVGNSKTKVRDAQ